MGKGKIAINAGLCKGCKYCILSCPKGVIALDTYFNANGYFPAVAENIKKCTGCALCAVMCPEVAIEVWSKSTPPFTRAKKTGDGRKKRFREGTRRD